MSQFEKQLSSIASSDSIQHLHSEVQKSLTAKYFDSRIKEHYADVLIKIEKRIGKALTSEHFDTELVRLADDFLGPHFDFIRDKFGIAENLFNELHTSIINKPERMGRLLSTALRGMHLIARRETNHAILTKGMLWRESLKFEMSDVKNHIHGINSSLKALRRDVHQVEDRYFDLQTDFKEHSWGRSLHNDIVGMQSAIFEQLSDVDNHVSAINSSLSTGRLCKVANDNVTAPKDTLIRKDRTSFQVSRINLHALRPNTQKVPSPNAPPGHTSHPVASGTAFQDSLSLSGLPSNSLQPGVRGPTEESHGPGKGDAAATPPPSSKVPSSTSPTPTTPSTSHTPEQTATSTAPVVAEQDLQVTQSSELTPPSTRPPNPIRQPTRPPSPIQQPNRKLLKSNNGLRINSDWQQNWIKIEIAKKSKKKVDQALMDCPLPVSVKEKIHSRDNGSPSHRSLNANMNPNSTPLVCWLSQFYPSPTWPHPGLVTGHSKVDKEKQRTWWEDAWKDAMKECPQCESRRAQGEQSSPLLSEKADHPQARQILFAFSSQTQRPSWHTIENRTENIAFLLLYLPTLYHRSIFAVF
jgi:hypothetical protein